MITQAVATLEGERTDSFPFSGLLKPLLLLYWNRTQATGEAGTSHVHVSYALSQAPSTSNGLHKSIAALLITSL